VAFALKKTSGDDGEPKKSALARLLGKKTDREPNGELPEVDVTAGVNRALRGANPTNVKSPEEDTESIVRVALLAIESALYTIDLIRDFLEQACEVAVSAKSVKDAGGRALLAERYDELRLSINDVLENIDSNAAQLVGQAPRHLDVWLGGKARYSVSSTRLDVSESGLNISPPRNAFSTFEEIDEALKELDAGLARADRAAASYCRDAQYLIARMKGEFSE